MLTFKDVKSEAAWDSFVSAEPQANFLQAAAWADIKLTNQPLLRRAGYDNHKLRTAYIAKVENARRGRYLTIAGGPILDWSDKRLVKATIADIKHQAQQAGCVFIRIRPQLENSPRAINLFKQLGLRPSPMHLSVEQAGVLDLNQSDDAIWAAMSQSLRRKIRQAKKASIQITTSRDMTQAKEFCQVHLKHAYRQSYTPFKPSALVEQFRVFAKRDQAIIYQAHHQGQLLAMNMIFFYGQEASYHYGVSTPAGSKLSVAPLLHLAAIEEARTRHQTRYNLWGIVPVEQPQHRFYGVSQFKRSFGVEELNYLPAHDLVLKPLAYSFNWLIETSRRRRRRLLR